MVNNNRLFIYGLMFGAVLLFCLSLTSAFEFDNVVRYTDLDMKVTVKNAFGLGSDLGTLELKSHSSVDEVLMFGFGKEEVVMYYDFEGWDNYVNGFGEVQFYNNTNGERIDREYYYVEYSPVEVVRPHYDYIDIGKHKNGSTIYEYQYINSTNVTVNKWINLTENIIKNKRIGVKTFVYQDDEVDVIWIVAGQSISKHASFGSSLDTGLIAYYQLEDNLADTDVIDATVNGEDGLSTVDTDTYSIAGGRIGRALDFSSSEYVNLTDMLSGSAGFTISAWIQTNSLGTARRIISKDDEASSYQQMLRMEGANKVQGGVYSTGGATFPTSDTILTTGSWYFVVLVYDKTNSLIYVNGSLDMVPLAQTGNLIVRSDIVTIGSQKAGSGELWDGIIDEVGIWSRSLTSAEVTELWNGGAGLTVGDSDNPPTAELGTPTNDTTLNTNSISQDFTCKGIDGVKLDNLTFYLWNITSEDLLTTETNTDGQNNTLETFSYTLTGGTNYTWNCLAMDNSSQSAFATNNSTINVISIPDNAPNIEIGLGNPSAGAEYSADVLATFNASNVYDDYLISNVSLYINKDGAGYVLNQTNTSGLNNTNYIFPLIPFDEGLYLWYLSAVDNSSQESTTAVRNFTIDTIAPTLTLNAPLTNTTTKLTPVNISLNFTTTDLHLDTTSCFYNITSPVYFTCNTLVNMTFASGGLFNISYGANDTFNNANSSAFSHYVYIYNDSVEYTAVVLEGETNIIYLSINATIINNLSAYLTYDGVNYSSTLESNNGSVAILSNTFNVPVGQNTTEKKLFNFTFDLDGVIETTDNFNQTVTFLTELNITSAECSDKALKFTLVDEVNSSNITGDIYYNFEYGTQNNSLKTAYGYINDTLSFYLCINGTLNRDYVVGYGELQYTTPDHVDRRYYLFINTTLNNDSYEERDLRNLRNSLSVTFENTFEDTSLNVYPSKYMGLWRWYPGFNGYLLVEMAKTDDDGEAISHLVTEDVDYRVGLYETNGSLIKLSEPKRFVCASSPCSFTLTVDADETDYTSVFDVETSLTYNATSMGFTLIYNDPNQLSSSIRLLVTREQGDNSLTICDVSSAEFSGVLTCDTSLYTTGIKKAVVYRSASPPIVVAQKLVQDGTTALNSNLGLIFSLILFLAIIFTGMVSPVWTVILAILGLIPAFAFGSINLAIFTGVAVLGAIIIHFVKRAVAR